MAINCAALPDQLLESELFGHERGAFTGAVARQAGANRAGQRRRAVSRRSREIDPVVQDISPACSRNASSRLGSTRVLRAEIRVIAATNRDLHAAMQRGEFREDLYYRLGVFEIALPPLRERLEDVLELADTFLEQIGETVGKPAAGIARDARISCSAIRGPATCANCATPSNGR